MKRVQRSSLLVILVFALVCGGAAAGLAGPDEPSVRPGINDSFLDSELDVDQWVARFEVEAREIYVSREAIVAALGLRPGGSVADIGAGTGLFLAPFAEAVGETGRAWCVEAKVLSELES